MTVPSELDPGARHRQPIDAQLQDVLDQEARRERDAAPPTTAVALRQQLRRTRAALAPYHPAVHEVESLLIAGVEGHDIACRMYRPVPDAPFLVVYFHGGGWVVGDLDTADGNARHLAVATGADVVSVDYRKAPEHPFPAGLDDAISSVRTLADRFGRGRRVAVAGDSAGANLAAVCARRLASAHGGPVVAQLLAYPVTDCDLTRSSYADEPHGVAWRAAMAWCWDLYAPDVTARIHPDASPIRADDVSHAPPAVVLLAGHDGLFDEGAAYARRLADEGVAVTLLVYESALHGFLAYAGLVDLSSAAIAAAGRALRDATLAPDASRRGNADAHTGGSNGSA